MQARRSLEQHALERRNDRPQFLKAQHDNTLKCLQIGSEPGIIEAVIERGKQFFRNYQDSGRDLAGAAHVLGPSQCYLCFRQRSQSGAQESEILAQPLAFICSANSRCSMRSRSLQIRTAVPVSASRVVARSVATSLHGGSHTIVPAHFAALAVRNSLRTLVTSFFAGSHSSGVPVQNCNMFRHLSPNCR